MHGTVDNITRLEPWNCTKFQSTSDDPIHLGSQSELWIPRAGCGASPRNLAMAPLTTIMCRSPGGRSQTSRRSVGDILIITREDTGQRLPMRHKVIRETRYSTGAKYAPPDAARAALHLGGGRLVLIISLCSWPGDK